MQTEADTRIRPLLEDLEGTEPVEVRFAVGGVLPVRSPVGEARCDRPRKDTTVDPHLQQPLLNTLRMEEDHARAAHHRLASRARSTGRSRQRLARGLLRLATHLEPELRRALPQSQ